MNKKKQLQSSVEEEETKKPTNISKKDEEDEEEEIEGVETQKRDKKMKGKKQLEGIDSGKEFDTYIFRLLKSQHPSIGITQKAMKMCNDIVSFQFHQILNESKSLTDFNSKQTLGYREVEAATKLTLPIGSSFREECVKGGRRAIESYSITDKQ
jgi:hypothetical protein